MEFINGIPQPVDVSNTYIKATYFEVVASGVTSGTITKPAGNNPEVEFVMDCWGTDTDALVSTMSNGKPTYLSPVTSGGSKITTTFNTSGEFAFSGTPSPAGEHAVIYVYRCFLQNFIDTESLFEIEMLDSVSHDSLEDVSADDHHNESHSVTSHSDIVDATGAQLEELTGAGDTTLHDHDGISENTNARHTQGTDTALGTQVENLDMGNYKVVSAGDATEPLDLVNLVTMLNTYGFVMSFWLMPTSLLSDNLTISVTEGTQVISASAELTSVNTFFKSTIADTPTPFVIKNGTVIPIHIQAKVGNVTGYKAITLHTELWRVDSGGSANPAQIGADSDSTIELTTDKTLYEFHLHVATETVVAAGSRLWLRIWATVGAGAQNPTVTIYSGDVHDHINISVSGTVLGRYLQLAGGTMSGDIAMGGTQQVTGLQAPDTNGDAIRATAKITEVNLESAVDLKHSNATDHTAGTDPNDHASGSDDQDLSGYYLIANLEDTPTEDEADKAPTSEWAFDHDALATAHHDNSEDHVESHSVASHNDTTATGTELETLTDGSDGDSLHIHAPTKTTATWTKTVGSGGDYETWAAMVADMPDLIYHAVNIELIKGTSLAENLLITNKRAMNDTAQINVYSSTRIPGDANGTESVDSATSTSFTDAAELTGGGDDKYLNCFVIITDGTGTDNPPTQITGSTSATGVCTVASWTGTQPDNTSKYIIAGARFTGVIYFKNNTCPIDVKGIVSTGAAGVVYDCIEVVFQTVGVVDASDAGVSFFRNNYIEMQSCGVVDCNAISGVNFAGIKARGNLDFYIANSNVSDNGKFGILAEYGGIVRTQNVTGDGNGDWGSYARTGAQITGTCALTGTSGARSDTGSAGTNSVDQAVNY